MSNTALKLLIVFIFIDSSLIAKINCEIFSAIQELEKLAVNEKFLIKEFKVFASQVNDDYINRRLIAWQNEHKLVEEDVVKYITNPLNAFLMIKRATSDINLIRERYPERSKDFLLNVTKHRPGDFELVGAVGGLVRLQIIYKLESEDFAKGIIDGKQTRSMLSAHDLFVLGEEILKMTDLQYFATKYLSLALEAIKDGYDDDKDVDKNILLLHLASCYKRSGNYENVVKVIEDLFDRKLSQLEFNKFKQLLLEGQTNKLWEDDPYPDHFHKDGIYSLFKEVILYSQVCRGSVTKSPEELATLHCRYTSISPFSKLARFKVEESNLDPYIVLFHDVLSHHEIEFLQNVTKRQVNRAKIGLDETSYYRIAQLAWLNDRDYEIVKKISQRVEDMTGLTMETAEGLQVQNYGIAGHYAPHWDHKLKDEKPFEEFGNRIATMLFYLTDVEKGGETVFPYLKLRIPARKGTAAFWYNLRTTGEGDVFTRHAGCPVLLGDKWVANKWIHEHGQEFRRPCKPENFAEVDQSSYYRDFF